MAKDTEKTEEPTFDQGEFLTALAGITTIVTFIQPTEALTALFTAAVSVVRGGFNSPEDAVLASEWAYEQAAKMITGEIGLPE